MGFSQAQHDAATNKVKSGIQQIAVKNQLVMPAASKATSHWYLPDGVKKAIMWAAKKLTEISEWTMKKLGELLEGMAAPGLFYRVGWDWENVKGKASGIQGSVNPDALKSSRWEGMAKDDYLKAIKLQAPAAGRIKDIANSTANSLFLCATAGMMFYASLAFIAFKSIGVLEIATVALLSGVFSWAGLLAALSDAGVNAGLIWGAVTLLTACLLAQTHQMGALHGETVDNTTFPQGHWPKATA